MARKRLGTIKEGPVRPGGMRTEPSIRAIACATPRTRPTGVQTGPAIHTDSNHWTARSLHILSDKGPCKAIGPLAHQSKSHKISEPPSQTSLFAPRWRKSERNAAKTAEERAEQTKRSAQRKLDGAAAAEAVVDEKI